MSKVVVFSVSMVPGVMLYIQYWWSDGTGTTVRWNRQPLFFISQDPSNTFHLLASKPVNYSASVASHDAKVW